MFLCNKSLKKYNLELRKSRVPIYRMRVKKTVCRRKKREDCNNTCKCVVGRLRKICIKNKN